MKKLRAVPGREPQVSDLLDHAKPARVLAEVRRLFRAWYPASSFRPVAKAFALTRRLYLGRFPGYGPCRVEYHDLYHTLQVFSATARLLDGLRLSGRSLPDGAAANLLVAALLHDTGYIQDASDHEGTGAKFTKTHVDRSAVFVREEAEAFGLAPERSAAIGRIILGTDLARPWAGIPFADPEEAFVASVLAAADLLGQMSDRAYLERLLFLYYEFREAGIEGYATAFDVLKKTAGFFTIVKARLDGPLGGASSFARLHFAKRFGLDADLYRQAIDRQMVYLEGIMADDKTNFRRKLHRLDLEGIERERA